MSIEDQDNGYFDQYAQSEQYQIDQTIFNEWQIRVYTNGEQLGVHFDQTYQDQANASAARLNAFQAYKDVQTVNPAPADIKSPIPVVWNIKGMAKIACRRLMIYLMLLSAVTFHLIPI